MILFSISQLGRFSGLKPHTIRAWEARYKALRPGRSVGNTRYYDMSQMRRLMNMASLVKAGYRASEVAGLPDERLTLMMETVFNSHNIETEEYFIFQLISAGLTYDAARFDKIFNHCIRRFRLKNTYQYVLIPMLERIGLLWKCDKASPTQEHFVSNLLRRKLFASVESITAARPDADRWLLFLPESEFHELGLLVAYNLIRLAGQEAIYLGANVPFDALHSAINEIKPDHLLFFSMHHEPSKSIQGFIKRASISFPGKTIFFAGSSGIIDREIQSNKVRLLSTVESLTRVLAES